MANCLQLELLVRNQVGDLGGMQGLPGVITEKLNGCFMLSHENSSSIQGIMLQKQLMIRLAWEPKQAFSNVCQI